MAVIRIVFIILLLSRFCAFSQDSLIKKNCHVVGFGSQFLTDRSIARGHGRAIVNYNLPGYEAFYRFEMVNKKQGKFCIGLSLCYREGQGNYYGDGAISWSSSWSGSFKVVRAQISPSYVWTFGKRKSFGFGTGLYIGFKLYADGETKHDFHDGFANIHTSEMINSGEQIDRMHFGNYVEFQQRFKFIGKTKLFLGVKGGFDSNEGYSSTMSLFVTPFLAIRL